MQTIIAVLAAAGPDLSDPLSIVAAILSAVGEKNWLFLTGGLIVGAVWLLRTVGGKLVPWFRTDRGGAVLVLVCGLLTSAADVIFGGFSWQALLNGLMAAFVAAGGFSVVKKSVSPSDKPGAPNVA